MRKTLMVFLIACNAAALFAQQPDLTINAMDIFNKTSDLYAKLTSLQAVITITKGDITQAGVMFYNNQWNMLKIEFYNPQGQILLIDRDKLQIYLPSHQTILEQSFTDSSTSIASQGGFTLLKDNYIISFAEAGLVPLDKDSPDKVYKLSCYPYAGSKEGFKYLIVSILPESNLIRRIEAVNIKNEKITFDYSNIIPNAGIPYTKFTIDPPNLTNVYPNFLNGAEE